jgi:hypothetical protein
MENTGRTGDKNMKSRFKTNEAATINPDSERARVTYEMIEYARTNKGDDCANKIHRILNRMSDDEFEYFWSPMFEPDESGFAIFVRTLFSFQQISSANVASWIDLPAMITVKQSKAIWNEIRKSSSTDIIEMTRETADEFVSLYSNSTDEFITVPSDLFFSETIPLKRCTIHYMSNPQDSETLRRFDVIIFDNYKKSLDETKDGEVVTVGAVVDLDGSDWNIAIPIYAGNGKPGLFMDEITTTETDSVLRAYIRACHPSTIVNSMIGSIMPAWYGMQLSLLHPDIKEVLVKDYNFNESPVTESTTDSRGRVTEYVRHKFIKPMNLIKKANMHRDGFTRKTLSWYVIGHWREYKATGKKVFIQGYWKGEMRHLQKNLDKGRIRIVKPEIHNDED